MGGGKWRFVVGVGGDWMRRWREGGLRFWEGWLVCGDGMVLWWGVGLWCRYIALLMDEVVLWWGVGLWCRYIALLMDEVVLWRMLWRG